MKKSISLLVARPFCFKASQRGTKKKKEQKRGLNAFEAHTNTHTHTKKKKRTSAEKRMMGRRCTAEYEN